MKVVVAGGSGFIGRATVRALHAAGHEVCVLSRTHPAFPPGVLHHRADLTEPLTLEGASDEVREAVASAQAWINLVGIARETPQVSFQSAHVDVVEHMLDACQRFGIERVVHISVVRIDASQGAYHRTKRDGESRVTKSATAWTILRPGLVYGPGDDMMSNLVGFVRAAPVFPTPGGEPGRLDIIDVETVAQAIVRCLDNPTTHHQHIDVVGTERVDLAALVRRVSGALRMPTLVVPLPRVLMRTATAAMGAVLPRPPITQTQLSMLIEGLYGDPTQAAECLDLDARPLSPERIREVALSVPPHAGPPSVRLVSTARERNALERWSVPPVAIAGWILLMAVLPWRSLSVPLTIPLTMLALNLVAGLTLWWARPDWMHRPSLRRLSRLRGVATGLLCGAVGLVLARITLTAIERFAPEALTGVAEVVGWADSWHWAAGLSLLIVVVALEDLVWRFGVTMSLVRRFGPLGAAALGAMLFALAHATVGPPILALAAALAGFAWNVIALRTRSWLAVSTCHVVWDVAMLATL